MDASYRRFFTSKKKLKKLKPLPEEKYPHWSIWNKVGFGSSSFALFVVAIFIMVILLPSRIAESTPWYSLGKGTVFGGTLAISNIAFAFISPLAGSLSDSMKPMKYLGRRFPFVFVGAIIMSLSIFGFGFAHTIPAVFGFWFFLVVGYSIIGATLNSVVPDLAPPKQRGTISSWIVIESQIGGIVGSLLGLLFHYISPTLICIGIGILYLFVTGLTVLSTPRPTKILLEEEEENYLLRKMENEEMKNESIWKQFQRFFVPLKRIQFVIFLLCVFFINTADTLITNFLFYYLSDVVDGFQIIPYTSLKVTKPEQAISVIEAFINTFAIIGALIMPRISDYLQDRRATFTVSALCMSVGIIGYLFTRQFYLTLLFSCFYGMGYGAQFSILFAILADLVNSQLEEENLPKLEKTEVYSSNSDIQQHDSIRLNSQTSFPSSDSQTNKSSKGNARDTGLWQMALLGPKIFAPGLGGLLLDQLQTYGKHHNYPHLGYLTLYSIGFFFAISSSIIVLFLKNHFHKEVQLPDEEEESDLGEYYDEESVLIN